MNGISLTNQMLDKIPLETTFCNMIFFAAISFVKSRLGDVGQGFNIVKVELDTYLFTEVYHHR